MQCFARSVRRALQSLVRTRVGVLLGVVRLYSRLGMSVVHRLDILPGKREEYASKSNWLIVSLGESFKRIDFDVRLAPAVTTSETQSNQRMCSRGQSTTDHRYVWSRTSGCGVVHELLHSFSCSLSLTSLDTNASLHWHHRELLADWLSSQSELVITWMHGKNVKMYVIALAYHTSSTALTFRVLAPRKCCRQVRARELYAAVQWQVGDLPPRNGNLGALGNAVEYGCTSSGAIPMLAFKRESAR